MEIVELTLWQESVLGFIGLALFAFIYLCGRARESALREEAEQANWRRIQAHVFDIIYDWHPEKNGISKPNVLRLKTLDKYFNLDEVRERKIKERKCKT